MMELKKWRSGQTGSIVFSTRDKSCKKLVQVQLA